MHGLHSRLGLGKYSLGREPARTVQEDLVEISGRPWVVAVRGGANGLLNSDYIAVLF